MKKTLREHRIDYASLQSVIDFADGIIEQNTGMTYKDFTLEYDSEWDSYYVKLTYSTPETLLEKENRERKEELQKQRDEEWNKREFERLKKLGYK